MKIKDEFRKITFQRTRELIDEIREKYAPINISIKLGKILNIDPINLSYLYHGSEDKIPDETIKKFADLINHIVEYNPAKDEFTDKLKTYRI